ncbi:hypothetical protein [Streptomyces rapamycinicus]|uniref:Uncharacterized protein n=2 Tax=Streptomyces rapamycinicus TaxID=1226757 RepID=A0A0A0N3A6_STRRN|nr:hypothetical protein [Streptomyces rapamycinicus]AGP51877.1 hypothetical protein M271_01200 [Streptomyces rapamycinicus NRRL 5491]MBB4779296.1 hypothetical protein [Streptomyces rapamycinicus]RLV76041.1 hypothetical protein D3C57_142485 [Streptomyces rapamycinicus NRRL 5491]UTP28084.1 hypothetical protein LIV37_01130 [Streptomyces rapamycinicus NRRL 5491]
MPAAGETERAPNIAKNVWHAAGRRAKDEGLPLIWVASRALTDYAAGTLALPRTSPNPEARDRRGRTIFTTDAVWHAANERRTKDAVRSMSALVEILLDAYARGEVHTHAHMVTSGQRDALVSAGTPDGPTGATRVTLSAA